MNTIIACTDFSPNATNAVQYAAALAQAVKARLVLFHHFTYPVPATDFPGAYPAVFVDEMAADLERQLQDIKADLVRSHHIEVDCVVRSWALSSDLKEVFDAEQADLVVMGTQGKSAVINALFGSATAAAIRRGKFPLLVVPRGVVFHPLKKILFPCDRHVIPNPDMLQVLRDLALAFDAYIEVFTMFDLGKTPELVPGGTASAARSNLEALLAGTRHGYSYENESAVGEGILYEAARSSASLVAMIPHHHSFWSNLLNQSETQRVASAILLPLLVLGERAKDAVEEEAEVEDVDVVVENR